MNQGSQDRKPGAIYEEYTILNKCTGELCETISDLLLRIAPVLSPKESNPTDEKSGELCPAQSPIADQLLSVRKLVQSKTVEVMDAIKRCQL